MTSQYDNKPFTLHIKSSETLSTTQLYQIIYKVRIVSTVLWLRTLGAQLPALTSPGLLSTQSSGICSKHSGTNKWFSFQQPGPPINITTVTPLWDYGFESRRNLGCLSVVRVACCQVEVSALDWSLIQRFPTECGVYKWAWWWSLDNLEPLTHEGADVSWKMIITSVLHTNSLV